MLPGRPGRLVEILIVARLLRARPRRFQPVLVSQPHWSDSQLRLQTEPVSPAGRIAGSQQVQLQTSISSLQSLDYATAITTLDQQNTTLSAALQAYTLTQGLSLFKFIQ